MISLLITPLIALVFLTLVLSLWLITHLLATRQLGERKQGCKGATRSATGEMMCCKGDGSLCEEYSGTNIASGNPLKSKG